MKYQKNLVTIPGRFFYYLVLWEWKVNNTLKKKIREMIKDIDELCFLGTPVKKMEELMVELFYSVTKISDIQKYYFRVGSGFDRIEIKSGIEKTLETIFSQSDFCKFTPFSELHYHYFLPRQKYGTKGSESKFLSGFRGSRKVQIDHYQLFEQILFKRGNHLTISRLRFRA